MDRRGKMQCSRCMTINETCCDGGQCRPEYDADKLSESDTRDDQRS